MTTRLNQKIAVDIREVSFTYPEGTRALSNINLHVGEGEFIALLASNGSGKTTLIKVLVGLLTPQEGRVFIRGDDIQNLSRETLYQHIGLVFQNPQDQLFAATVLEDVAFGPRNLGLGEDDVQARVSEALNAVSAWELRDRAIHHLSFGQQKRVAIAGVLAMHPSILVLDEPMASLDPAGEAMMMRLLHTLNQERNMTIVLATHSVDVLPLFAHQIVVLHRGEQHRWGTPEDIFSDHEMLKRTGLRLPYVSRLFDEMKRYDGVPLGDLPLTIGEARQRLLELISEGDLLPAIGASET